MTLKAAVGLTVLFVALFGVNALNDCEEHPNLFCILQAMFNPLKSFMCLQAAAETFEVTTNRYYFSILQCNKEIAPNLAIDVFENIMRDILTASTKIKYACNLNTLDIIKESFWCSSKIVYEYIRLRFLLGSAESTGSRSEQFNNCVAPHIKEYIERFPATYSQLNACIFKEK